MEVLIRNAEGNLPSKEREYASKKLGRLERYFGAVKKVEIVHREEKSLHHIEVTVFADGYVLRGEEHDQSVLAAIDNVAEKLEGRLSRLKGKLVRSHRRSGRALPPALVEDGEHAESSGEILKRKQFSVKPIALEEAALQMELVGNPFYVFLNSDSGKVEVLYKRKNGGYGLLEPER